MHVQVFVQCLHQHTPLHELVQLPKGVLGRLVEEYKRYKRNACRQEYADVEGRRSRKAAVEKAWPAYRESTDLVSAAEYLSWSTRRVTGQHDERENAERPEENEATLAAGGVESAAPPSVQGRTWLQEYLGVWVQRGQEFRQNHVHQRGKRLQRMVP